MLEELFCQNDSLTSSFLLIDKLLHNLVMLSSQHLGHSQGLFFDKDTGLLEEYRLYSFQLPVKVGLDLGNLLMKQGFHIIVHNQAGISTHHGVP